MSEWIKKSAKLLGRSMVKPAAGIASAHVCPSGARSTDEALMSYALADSLLEETLHRIMRQKDTASDEDEENLTMAINLAKAAIPSGHPLLWLFLKRASYYRTELEAEVAVLGKWVEQNIA